MRPPVKRSSGRYWMTLVVTPMKGRKIRVPVTRLRPSPGTKDSKTTMGSAFCQCGDHLQPCRPESRHRGTDQSHQYGTPEAHHDDHPGHGKPVNEPGCKREGPRCQRESESRAGHADQHGLRQDEHEHGTIGKADGL